MGAERLSLRLAPSRALPTSLLVRPRLLFPATRSTLPVAFQTSILTTSQRYISSSRFLSNMSPTDEKQHAHVLSLVKRMVPPLSAKLHKGQAGRIGVLGGSGDYSGAPFFAAMGAMRFGADLAHVICEPGAGAVIKTYAPDLIVHTFLDSTQPNAEDTVKMELEGLLDRLHALIIGPGLGRSEFMQSAARIALKLARERDIGVVVDADGLWLLNSEPELVRDWKGEKRVILTPNVMEFGRLCDSLGLDKKSSCADLARSLGGVTILQKGQDDVISDGAPIPLALLHTPGGTDHLVDSEVGGLKRVGGQGDILCGTVGTLLAWGREWSRGAYESVGHAPTQEEKEQVVPHVALLAAYGGSTVNRQVSFRGFNAHRRSMVTHDLLEYLGGVHDDLFGEYGEWERENKEGIKRLESNKGKGKL